MATTIDGAYLAPRCGLSRRYILCTHFKCAQVDNFCHVRLLGGSNNAVLSHTTIGLLVLGSHRRIGCPINRRAFKSYIRAVGIICIIYLVQTLIWVVWLLLSLTLTA